MEQRRSIQRAVSVHPSILKGKDINSFKKEQAAQVTEAIQAEGVIHTDLISKEVERFYWDIEVDDGLFATVSTHNITSLITSIYAGKILSANADPNHAFNLKQETLGSAFYVCKSEPGLSVSNSVRVERVIDAKYLMEGYADKPIVDQPYRLKVFRTANSISKDMDINLRIYLLQKPVFPEGKISDDECDLAKVADVSFLSRSTVFTRNLYQSMIKKAKSTMSPTSEVVKLDGLKFGRRIVIAYRTRTTHSFFSALTDLYHQHGLTADKKFVEQFKNCITIISLYFRPVDSKGLTEALMDKKMKKFQDDVALMYVLPRTSLTPLLKRGELSFREVSFMYVVWKFAHQFLSKYQSEYSALYNSLKLRDPSQLGNLIKMKQNLRKDTFTETKIQESLSPYTEFIKKAYAIFESVFDTHRDRSENKEEKVDDSRKAQLSSLYEYAKKVASSEFDYNVLASVCSFIQSVVKTNFFKNDKVALSFRLDPDFLSDEEYVRKPFGVFFIVGSEFRGFHIRFEDIARGGIRVIQSRSAQAFSQNVGTVFSENFDLAFTQQSKNKDIPEGGSKGTILLTLQHQDKAFSAFQKYIDALLDLLLASEEVIDFYGEPEILFLGPDEGTAEFMEWGALHARTRGARFWKSFTTGKPLRLGGIPHDTYGMTTKGVHQYKISVLNKLNLDETKVTKVQTGGPDGDLGSNECKISKDRTIVIIDGHGVLFDPNGIDREGLIATATDRKTCRFFPREKIGKGGFYVDIDDRDVVLPDGTRVESGLFFRNNFHVSPRLSADILVPCGGRPKAVNINNVDKLLFDNGKPRYKAIIEGANLFVTQDARLALEKAGVILFKDASANKGGVTSSSLEVLSALALTDEEFSECMMVKDENNPPKFYQTYVNEILEFIANNCAAEFNCIWNENERTGKPKCVVSDILSKRVNELNNDLRNSSLWENEELRKKVIAQCCPKVLIEKVGLDNIMKRVPEAYQKAMFGSKLASMFVFKYGLNPSQFAFYDFINGLKA